MKKYFYITGVLLLLSTGALSQVAPRNATRIILSNTLSKEENYREVGRILLDNDFMIDYSDKELGFLNTAPYNNKIVISKFRIVVKDKEVVLSGKCKYDDDPDSYIDIKNAGWIWGNAFDMLHDLALKIPHDSLDYGSSER